MAETTRCPVALVAARIGLPIAAASENSRRSDFNPLESHLERILVVSNRESRVTIDQFVFDQLLEARCEVLHAIVCTNSDRVGQFVIVAFQNQLLDDRLEEHDFDGRDPPDFGIDRFQELLRNDAPGVEGQRAADRAVR